MGDLVSVAWSDGGKPWRPAEELDRDELMERCALLGRELTHTRDLYARSLSKHLRLYAESLALDLMFAEVFDADPDVEHRRQVVTKVRDRVLARRAEEREAEERREAALRAARKPDPAPHDINEFTWDECTVERIKAFGSGAGPWRVTWRGGEVYTWEPVPVHQPVGAPSHYWAPLCFENRVAAERELARRRTAPAAELTLFDLAGIDAAKWLGTGAVAGEQTPEGPHRVG